MTQPSNTIILGAGIIGLSTAYYLCLSTDTPATSIHLVESSPQLFASASGYAGGFLASDWFAAPVAELGALSFRLHTELAAQHNGRERWGWSRSTGTSLASSSARGLSSGHDWLRQGGSRAETKAQHEFWGDREGPAWLAKREGESVDVISADDSTAQVDPRRLCEFLCGEVRRKGVVVHQPAWALSVSEDLKGSLATVRIAEGDGEEVDVPCSRLVITAGAWTPQVFSTLFPSSTKKIPISSLAGHSLVVHSPRWRSEHETKGCHAVFATDTHGFAPEIFSRIGSEIYIAGLNDASLPLPKVATESEPDPKSIEKLKEVAKHMLGVPGLDDDLEIIREGLCFRPVARGHPIVSRIPESMLGGITTRAGGDGGVYLAAGHGPWGISQSLGTGKVMSELIEGKRPSADIRALELR